MKNIKSVISLLLNFIFAAPAILEMLNNGILPFVVFGQEKYDDGLDYLWTINKI